MTTERRGRAPGGATPDRQSPGLNVKRNRILVGDLIRAYVYVLFIFTLLWVVVSLVTFRDILISDFLLVSNLLVAAPVGYYYYRYRYHETLELDDEGFSVWRGGRTARASWEEFKHVSLVHVGRGLFAVRLYLDADLKRSVDLNASRLGIDPYWLRDTLTELVRKKGKSPGPAIPPPSEAS